MEVLGSFFQGVTIAIILKFYFWEVLFIGSMVGLVLMQKSVRALIREKGEGFFEEFLVGGPVIFLMLVALTSGGMVLKPYVWDAPEKGTPRQIETQGQLETEPDEQEEDDGD